MSFTRKASQSLKIRRQQENCYISVLVGKQNGRHPHVYRKNTVFSAPSDSLEKKKMLRYEQRSVQWMMDPVSNFCKEVELVLYTCVGNLAAAKAFLQLLELRTFGSFEPDFMCLQDALSFLAEVKAKQVFIS